MSGLQMYNGQGQMLSRQAARTVGRIQSGSAVDLAQIDARAEVQAAQIDAMTAVTQRGLQSAAYITNVEMALAEACPAAMSRLKVIGDTGSMAVGGIVMDTACKLRRI